MPIFFYNTDIGRIGIEEQDGSIVHLYFEGEQVPQNADIFESSLIKEAASQLKSYLAGDLQNFSLPLTTVGTPFMKKVWQLLCEIPYGETITYQEMAQRAGSPKGARAAGLACNRNPIPIFIPCHRVIGSNGKLVGFGGGLNLKEQLLLLESGKLWQNQGLLKE